jgi:hypothetical protein
MSELATVKAQLEAAQARIRELEAASGGALTHPSEDEYRAAKAAYYANKDDAKAKAEFLRLKAVVTAAHNEMRAHRTEEVGVDHKGRPVYRRVTPIARAS